MDGREACQLLADRLETLIGRADDYLRAMDEIAEAAEKGGLIDSDNVPRRESAAAFVTDLLLENPLAADWMNARLPTMKPGDTWKEISDLAEHLL